jgi:putative CocE/NonD family hydrolase
MSSLFPRRFLVLLIVAFLALLMFGASMATAAESPDTSRTEVSSQEQAAGATTATPGAYELEKIEEEWIMPDGVDLPVSIYYPAGVRADEEFPLIVVVHGWTLDRTMTEWAAEYYASRGYVCVAFTARGWFGAGGQVGCMDPENDIKDLSEIITLASRDERLPVLEDEKGPVVGVTGASMGGCFSYLIAPREDPRPGDPGDPRVRTVVPMHGSFDLLFSLYPNDTLKFFWATALLATSYMGNLSGFMMKILSLSMDENSGGWQKMYAIIGALWDLMPPVNNVTTELPYIYGIVSQRRYDEEEYARAFFKRRSARYWCDEEYDGVVEHPFIVPMLILAGWNDDLFFANEGLMAYSSAEAPKRIIITNHGHLGCYPGPYPGGIEGSPESAWVMEQVDMWFDHYLKGIENGIDEGPGVFFCHGGDPTDFEEAATYPLPGTDGVSLYLGRDEGGAGSLDASEPRGSSQPDFLLNIGITGSLSLFYFQDAPQLMGGEVMDIPRRIKFFEIPFTERGYISEPLTGDVTIMGPPSLKMYYQGSAPFIQLIPWLYEVAPDGTETLVSRGFYEGRNYENPWSMKDTGEKPVEMQACYHRFAAGSRIKLEISTADLITCWPVWNFGFILLHHAEGAASRLILPVVPDTY